MISSILYAFWIMYTIGTFVVLTAIMWIGYSVLCAKRKRTKQIIKLLSGRPLDE